MAEVYSHSYLNLAAAASSDSNGGLFRQRAPHFATKCLVDLTWSSPAGSATRAFLLLSTRRIGNPSGQCTIVYTRGWVFQERLLAPRVLNFTRNQLFWECNDLHASKSWPAGLPPGTVAVFKKDVLRETAQKRDLDISLWAWNSVVRNYSAGGLLPGMNNRASLKHASPCPNPVYVTNSNFPLAQPFLLPNSVTSCGTGHL
jgi:hypothetical protein